MQVKLLSADSHCVSIAVSDLEDQMKKYVKLGYLPSGGVSTTYEFRRNVSVEATASIVMIKS